MDFSSIKEWTISEGVVAKVVNASGVVIWEKPSSGNTFKAVAKGSTFYCEFDTGETIEIEYDTTQTVSVPEKATSINCYANDSGTFYLDDTSYGKVAYFTTEEAIGHTITFVGR